MLPIGQILYLTFLGLVVWYLGMSFTYGVKLFPRQRDQESRIIKHWLHDVEAYLWPVAWLVFATVWGLRRVGAVIQLFGNLFFEIGKMVGQVEPPTDPQAQRHSEATRQLRERFYGQQDH